MDWNKIRTEYISGYISYRKLAEKHGISFATLRDRAAKEKWSEQRKAQREKIQQKTAQKTADIISDMNADFAKELNSAASELLAKLKIAIQETDLYIERTRKRLPKKVVNKQTGETITAWVEEEEIRLAKKDNINIDSVLKLTSAIKTMQSIQLAGKEESQQSSAPTINITVSAATPADMEDDAD